MIDPALFADQAIDQTTRALNADIVATLSAGPDVWSMPIDDVRQRRREGGGPFPTQPLSPRAREIEIPGPAGPLALRIIAPDAPRGVYLHIHGGGWTWGERHEQDEELEAIAALGYACIAASYRLAPEHPYPAAPDDCEAAALWLLREGARQFGTTRFVIGGDSAGAHLALVTLLRLRDRSGVASFVGANLVAGCYDLGLTPSVRNWGPTKLVINGRDMAMFTRNFCGARDRADPDISPLFADLSGLPRMLLTVGTRDLLLDDTLFLAARLTAAGVASELSVAPGGCHMFQRFPIPIAENARGRIHAFFRDIAA
ncbi:MAG: alpha/beta hydrolase [Microvirga sp.]|nr:alpha/beta hydrolase [Microvirga sp.]